MINGKSLVSIIMLLNVVIALSSVVFIGAVIWVAVHFISKLW
jgi:hypothetical protein